MSRGEAPGEIEPRYDKEQAFFKTPLGYENIFGKTQGDGDILESVGCTNFRAGDESKINNGACDINGIFGVCCPHGVPLDQFMSTCVDYF
jgi:hypothetical protein